MTTYFEDLEVGTVVDLGERTVTEEEIVEFATRYDPQPFHVDEEAAAASPYGSLIASGWHTAALCMRLFVDGFLAEVASAGGRGVDDLRWYRPVRPGDTLSARVEIVETRPPRDASRPGDVRVELTGVNQDGDPVVSWVLLGMVERRGPA